MWYSCKNHSSFHDCNQTNKQRRQAPQGGAESKTRGTTYGQLSSIRQTQRGEAEPEMRRTAYAQFMSSIRQTQRGKEEPETRRTAYGGSSSRGQAPPGIPDSELNQCYSKSRYDAATGYFSDSYVLYNGVYAIYRGGPSYIIYRGMYIPDDISKLKEVSRLSHPNLASMDGYCFTNVETIVGYKNEGYQILLHQLTYCNLSWLQRLNICIDAAEALRCIHTAKIVHGGISPATILLNGNSCAKLVTFGSVSSHLFVFDARRLHIMPLDIAGSAKPTEKTDVYLFGLILLILYCGKNTDYSNGYPFLLPVIVREAINIRTLHHITDLNLTDIAEECLNEFLRVAFCCFSLDQAHRPSMDTVPVSLKRARSLQTHSSYEQRQRQIQRPRRVSI